VGIREREEGKSRERGGKKVEGRRGKRERKEGGRRRPYR
jgi:hypothetical protein